jgi:hypothetical protein
MCCPIITLLADGDADLTCESEDTCFALPVESKTGRSPRTPFIVSSTYKR